MKTPVIAYSIPAPAGGAGTYAIFSKPLKVNKNFVLFQGVNGNLLEVGLYLPHVGQMSSPYPEWVMRVILGQTPICQLSVGLNPPRGEPQEIRLRSRFTDSVIASDSITDGVVTHILRMNVYF